MNFTKKQFGLLLLTLLDFMFILPPLFSAKSDFCVVLGAVIMLGNFYLIYHVYMTNYKKFIKEQEEKNK